MIYKVLTVYCIPLWHLYQLQASATVRLLWDAGATTAMATTDSTLDALLTAVLEYPADGTRRLVYADALDDAGEHDRAEFIRLMIRRTEVSHADAATVGYAIRRVYRRNLAAGWLNPLGLTEYALKAHYCPRFGCELRGSGLLSLDNRPHASRVEVVYQRGLLRDVTVFYGDLSPELTSWLLTAHPLRLLWSDGCRIELYQSQTGEWHASHCHINRSPVGALPAETRSEVVAAILKAIAAVDE